MKTVRLRISGKVQGVFFRAGAKERAEQVGVTGWVRNTRDHGVEVLATGDQQGVGAFVAWCRSGPPKAVVEAVEILEEPLQVFERFEIVR